MKKIGLAVMVLIALLALGMLFAIPMAFAFGGAGGHGGGGGHSSGHANGHSGGEGGHGETSAHESESVSVHEESVPRRTNPFVVIPHGSNVHNACPNGVASEVEANASETAVQCYADPEPKSDNHVVAWAVAILGALGVLIAVGAS